MDIRLSTPSGRNFALTMGLDIEQIAAGYLYGIPRLTMQVALKRAAVAGYQPADRYPILLELHGALFSGTTYDSAGPSLVPPEELPVAFEDRDNEHFVALRFTVPTQFVHLLEEERAATQSGQDLRLGLRIWGLVAIARQRDSEGVAQPSNHLRQADADIIGFEGIQTQGGQQPIRIPRSDWLDRLLPALGYHRSVLIELPLTRTPPVAEAYQKAAASLDVSRQAFEHEDYPSAVKYAREVLEYLGQLGSDGKLTTYCKEKLEPVVGETKSKAIDRALNALRDTINASSHAGSFTADRCIASYVIETLAVNLRYISSVTLM
jgi:hypothetical protein